MIDLFGLDRGAAQEPPSPDAPEPASRGSHRLWAFLLVLDSIFVIVFGGAVAAKVYQYWRAPSAPPPAAARRRPAPKPAETPKPAESAPAPAPAPAPIAAKPAVPAKAPQQPEAAKHGEAAPRPPKPSMLTEAPKPRSTPALATAAAPAAASPAAASAAATTKAQPVVFKLRADAKAVQLVGAFIVHGGRKDMTKGADGVWSVKLYLNHGQYRYFFAVDKKKTLDPENPRSDRGASLLNVP